MATTLQIVVEPKLKKELKAMAKSEGRSLSNMAGWLLILGKQKFNEETFRSEPQSEVA